MKPYFRPIGYLVPVVAILFGACTPKLYEKGAVQERGKASYYGDRFNGKPTASGERFNQNKMTAAHPSIPFGTMVTVKNTSNGKKVNVRINDRGPSAPGRIIDVSKGAAKKLDMIQAGVAPVEISYRKTTGTSSAKAKNTPKTKTKKASFRRGKNR